MSATTPAETVWYRNTQYDTLHEVAAGSPQEKRLRKEQREVVDQESGESDFEAAYEKVNDRDLKALQSKPELLPGYPAGSVARMEKRQAKLDQETARADVLDRIILGQAPAGGLTEDEVQARIDKAVADAVAKLNTPDPKGK